MEKIGLINKIVRNIDEAWGAYQLLEESPAMQKRNEALTETLSLLKAVKAEKDIKLVLGVEEMLLTQELAVYSNSAEQQNSVNTAIGQLQDARRSLDVVQEHANYQSATATYPGSQKEAGLPIDSFRSFLKSHSTRLTNRMTAQLSVPEKNVLRQRKDNLGMIKEVYMTMQREALGLTTAKEKGLER